MNKSYNIYKSCDLYVFLDHSMNHQNTVKVKL